MEKLAAPGGGPPRADRLLRLAAALTSLLLTALVVQSITAHYRGPDLAARRLAERKAYYEKVILPAGLVPREGPDAISLPKDGKAIEDYGNRIFRNPGFVRSLTDQEKKIIKTIRAETLPDFAQKFNQALKTI